MLKNIFNKRTLLDLTIYLGIPLLIWNLCRPLLGDYFAMLLSTVPGIIYTIFTFFREKQFSITGLFILGSMIISGALDIYSKTAYQMLWNLVYLNIGLVIFWCFTIVIKRPMAMYFFIDYAYLQGVPKDSSRQLYRQMPFLKYFMLLTGFLAFRDLTDIFLRIFLIHLYDVDGFNTIKIITQIWSFITMFMFVFGIILIIKQIQLHNSKPIQENSNLNSSLTTQKINSMENQKKNVIPTPPKPPRIPEMPKMAGMGSMPAIPNAGFKGIKMVGVIKDKIWEHHKKFHLDANGDLKPKFKEMGLKLMEKFKG